MDITPARVTAPRKIAAGGIFKAGEKGAGCAVCNTPFSTGTFHEAKVHRDLDYPEMLREARETKTQL